MQLLVIPQFAIDMQTKVLSFRKRGQRPENRGQAAIFADMSENDQLVRGPIGVAFRLPRPRRR